MAGYRQFHTKFWKDRWVISLEPLERYLFSYLITNDSSSISGIYELPLRVIINETGLSEEFVSPTMAKFQDAKKIFYQDGILWVVNMRRYHKNASPHTMAKVARDIDQIPECEVKMAYLYYEATGIYSIDTVSIQYGYSEVKDKAKDKYKDKAKAESEVLPVSPELGSLVTAYERDFGVITPRLAEVLDDDLGKYGLQLCADAMTEALKNNVRKWSYVQGILKRWYGNGRGKEPAAQSNASPGLAYFDVGGERQFYQDGKLIRVEALSES